MFKNRWRLLCCSFGLFCSMAGAAHAHSEQSEPTLVQIVPRRDYLTVQIRGAAVDWRDVTSNEAHNGNGHQKYSEVSTPLDPRRAISSYVKSNLILEQGGQLLPLQLQSLQWKKSGDGADTSERVEIFLRAQRPAKLASAPLRVASDIFDHLPNASTLVQLGAITKAIQRDKTAEFPGAATLPTWQGDLKNFAWQGVAEPLSNLSHLFLLFTLLLGASLLPRRRLLWVVGALLVGQGVGLGLDFIGVFPTTLINPALVLALTTVCIGGLSWWMARRADNAPASGNGGLCFLAWVGGLVCGFSYLNSLRVWGLPESGLPLCGLALFLASTLAQILLVGAAWKILAHWQRRFTQQAQYGGMNWQSVVQIASLACVATGSFYSLQQFAS